jgi:hypothetical protein
MGGQWKIERLEGSQNLKSADSQAISHAFEGLRQIDECPGNLGCAAIGEAEFQVLSPLGGAAAVYGNLVEWEGRYFRDEEGRFRALIRGAFGPLAKMPRTPRRKCQQRRPPDYSKWMTEDHRLKNSCMNYAIDHLWNWNPGGARGIHPSTEPDKWAAYLAQFGIEKLAKLRNATTDGWPIALVFQPNELDQTSGEFHFLRLLKSGFWSHKFSSRPPALCDFSGNAIPKDSLKDANLCGYKFGAYFWVKKGTTIANRTRKKKTTAKKK